VLAALWPITQGLKHAGNLKVQAWAERTAASYRYSYIARFLMQYYQILCFAALNQLRHADFSSAFSAISSTIAALVVLLVHAAPVVTLLFYRRFAGLPADTQLRTTWGALLRNLKGRSYYYPVFLVRRLGLAYLLVFLDIQGLLQTLIASALAVASVAFTLRERPFTGRFHAILHYIDEVGICILTLLHLAFCKELGLADSAGLNWVMKIGVLAQLGALCGGLAASTVYYLRKSVKVQPPPKAAEVETTPQTETQPFKRSENSQGEIEKPPTTTPRTSNGDPDILLSAEDSRPVFSGLTHSGYARRAKNL